MRFIVEHTNLCKEEDIQSIQVTNNYITSNLHNPVLYINNYSSMIYVDNNTRINYNHGYSKMTPITTPKGFKIVGVWRIKHKA